MYLMIHLQGLWLTSLDGMHRIELLSAYHWQESCFGFLAAANYMYQCNHKLIIGLINLTHSVLWFMVWFLRWCTRGILNWKCSWGHHNNVHNVKQLHSWCWSTFVQSINCKRTFGDLHHRALSLYDWLQCQLLWLQLLHVILIINLYIVILMLFYLYC